VTPDRVPDSAAELRARTRFPAGESAFGTILKPTAGITPPEVGRLVEEAASCPLLMFVKEDENLYPNLDYSPARERTRQAVAAIERAREKRGGRGLIFAPHVTGAPHEILDRSERTIRARGLVDLLLAKDDWAHQFTRSETDYELSALSLANQGLVTSRALNHIPSWLRRRDFDQ